ncbi:MAG: hypothetical protein ACSHX0_12800 [Akkermansiaceae bacterium]
MNAHEVSKNPQTAAEVDVSNKKGEIKDFAEYREATKELPVHVSGRIDPSTIEENKWGGETTGNLSLKWLWRGALLTLVMIILGLVFHSLKMKSDEQGAVKSNTNQKALPEVEDPEKWFHDNLGVSRKKGVEILDSFLSLEDSEAQSLLVRDKTFFKNHRSESWTINKPRVNSNNFQLWSVGHNEQTAFLKLSCRDQLGMPFSAYFTRSGETIQLDWASSVRWSEVSLEPDELKKLGNEPKLIRCLIKRKEEFYVGAYNDQQHASYTLSSFDKVNTVWAYVDRGSELDEKLKSLLDYGSFVVSLKKDIRVTLKIARLEADALNSQVDIVELVHEDWVSP